VPKCPSAEEKFCTEVVVMVEDCFQTTVRVRREGKGIAQHSHWPGSLKRIWWDSKVSEEDPDGSVRGRTVEPATGNMLLSSIMD